MNSHEFIRAIIQFNKTNFEKSFSTAGNIQEKVVEKGNELLQKYSLFPEEGVNVISQWSAAMRNSMQLFQVVAEKNYEEIDNYLSVKK